jgi:hypothetical protein
MSSKKAVAVAAALGWAIWWGAGGFADADPTTTPPPAPKTSMDTDGTYVIGTDIVPGVYSSAGPAGDSPCYWKRRRGDEVLDNGLTKKPQVIGIEATDTVFKTSRCQPWQLVACPPTCPPPPQPPPPGLPGFAWRPAG